MGGKFIEGAMTTAEMAKRTAIMWKSNPTNRMQLKANVEAADADGSGTIDRGEFAVCASTRSVFRRAS